LCLIKKRFDSAGFMTDFSRRQLTGLMACGAALALAGCSPEINHRGYYAKSNSFAQISEGMAKSEVEAALGSPSTTASVNFQGDSYYYITSVTQGRAFMKPVEVSREVIAIRFDRGDQVASLAQYGLEDGRIIDINTRKTPVPGANYSILQELFGTVSRANPGTGMLNRRL
jgi:outer membrane protein assembly factor BamE (lipoprotein component of BamABCDE complex)